MVGDTANPNHTHHTKGNAMTTDLYVSDAREWLGSYDQDPVLLNWLIDVGLLLHTELGLGVVDAEADYIGMCFDGLTPQEAADSVIRAVRLDDGVADDLDEYLDDPFFDEDNEDPLWEPVQGNWDSRF